MRPDFVRPGERPWTPEEEAALFRLWNEDQLSGAEIGRQMGRSKNSVVGKARRLGLARRPSPILPPNPHSPKRRKRARLADVSDANVVPIVAAFEEEAEPVHPGPAIGRYAERSLGYETCQWLDGEPAARAFCGAPTVKGGSWCAEHTKRVFRKAKPIEALELAEADLVQRRMAGAGQEQASLEQASLEQASLEQASLEQTSLEQAGLNERLPRWSRSV